MEGKEGSEGKLVVIFNARVDVRTAGRGASSTGDMRSTVEAISDEKIGA
jgi:hypothetical protein